jgi:branched-chain amino acid transport system substrate-binding protein
LFVSAFIAGAKRRFKRLEKLMSLRLDSIVVNFCCLLGAAAQRSFWIAMRSETRGKLIATVAAVTAAMHLFAGSAAAQTREPIKIGFSMAMTGGLAPNGKSALLAQRIWEEDINAKGGLLGRPVKLIFYDDQSNPATVPGIYTKLLDVDRVDLVIGPYATAQIAPAMPIIIQRKKVFITLFGLAVNSEFKYPNYFSMIPNGPDPKVSAVKGFFDLAMEQNPKPQTLAIVSADQEYSRNASDGAREIAQKLNLKIVYDRTYPPSTADFAPIVRAIRATNPDILEINSYPPDSVGMVRAINESGYKPKMVGGGMVGLQATAFKTLLGPALNGFINYDFWLPVAKLDFPGVADLLKRYQARAVTEGVDALGYYMAPYAYAQLQVLQTAIEVTKSIDDKKLADYMRANTFRAVVGDIKFGLDGEWAQSRTLQVQFHDIKGNDLEQFRTMGTQTVVTPAEYASGKLIYPFEKAR